MRNTWKHIRRSPYQSMAAILTMFLTMFLAGIFFLVSAGSFFVLRYFESKPQITVFFSNTSTPANAETLKKLLVDTGKVLSVKYVSKDEALSIYREQNKNDPLLLEMVTPDILPASLEVSAVNPSYLNDLAPVMERAPGVEQVVFQKDVVNTLLKWTNVIRLVGLVVVGLFAVNAILIVMTVIGMKIATKRDEIEILTLIGASPWYIRMPFIMEGGMYGFLGATLSWIISTACLFWIRSSINGFLGMTPVIHTIMGDPVGMPFLAAISAYLFVLWFVGSLLGSLGSLVALGRYLKSQ